MFLWHSTDTTHMGGGIKPCEPFCKIFVNEIVSIVGIQEEISIERTIYPKLDLSIYT